MNRVFAPGENLAGTLPRVDSWKKTLLGVISFIGHQYLATLGIGIFSTYLVAYAFDVLRVFGERFPQRTLYWILTGTPYYPVQICVGLLLGWTIARRVQHRAMLWVWILPTAYLIYALIAIPTLAPQWIPPEYQAGVGESRFRHYFGWGCGDVHPCFDQAAITLLFYNAVAYSVGAWLARKASKRSPLNLAREIWKTLTVAVIFLLIAALESILIVKSGWKAVYLPLILTPAGISAFLTLYALLLHRQSVRVEKAGGWLGLSSPQK